MNDQEHFSRRERLLNMCQQIQGLITEYHHWGVPDAYQEMMQRIDRQMYALLWNVGVVPAKEGNIELAQYAEQLKHIHEQTRGLRKYGKNDWN